MDLDGVGNINSFSEYLGACTQCVRNKAVRRPLIESEVLLWFSTSMFYTITFLTFIIILLHDLDASNLANKRELLRRMQYMPCKDPDVSIRRLL